MRIDPAGQSSVPATLARAARPAEGNEPTAAGAGVGRAGAAQVFSPTSELTGLLAAAREQPEVRSDVIESVSARLAAGEFDGPDAAAAAARTMLGGC